MSARFLKTGLVVAALVSLLACDGRIPTVRGLGTVVPNLSPPSTVSTRPLPANDTRALQEESSESEACLEWETVVDYFNRWTGEYEQILNCAEGGDISSIHVLGTRQGSGGQERIIYTMRSGERVVWRFIYGPHPDDPTLFLDEGSSDQGESFEGLYRQLGDGALYVKRTWLLLDGEQIVEGVYEADNRFNGTASFDAYDTEHSPDWHLVNIEEADGSVMQIMSEYLDGWHYQETLLFDAYGGFVYDFDYDDLVTGVDPDYSGGYEFSASGAGEGGYLQRFDDDSMLEVEQVAASGGAYNEVWRFRDALTEQPVDQEGVLDYDAAGNGSGTITTYVMDGSAETCQLTISAEGSTVISSCN